MVRNFLRYPQPRKRPRLSSRLWAETLWCSTEPTQQNLHSNTSHYHDSESCILPSTDYSALDFRTDRRSSFVLIHTAVKTDCCRPAKLQRCNFKLTLSRYQRVTLEPAKLTVRKDRQPWCGRSLLLVRRRSSPISGVPTTTLLGL